MQTYKTNEQAFLYPSMMDMFSIIFCYSFDIGTVLAQEKMLVPDGCTTPQLLDVTARQGSQLVSDKRNDVGRWCSMNSS